MKESCVTLRKNRRQRKVSKQCQDDDGFLTLTREEALADVRSFLWINTIAA